MWDVSGFLFFRDTMCVVAASEVLRILSVGLALVIPAMVYVYVEATGWWFYTTLTLSVSFLVVWFPHTALYLHSKPFYYEDLAEPRFQRVFLRLQQIFTILAVVPSFLFYIERWQTPDRTHWYALFALWGGYNAFLSQILDPVGKILLRVVDYVRVHSPRTTPQVPLSDHMIPEDFALV